MKRLGLLTIVFSILTFNLFAQTAAQIKRANKLIQQGNEYSDKKEWDKAIASFTEVIKLRPNRPNAYINRGLAKYEQAIETPLKPGVDPRKTLESAVSDFSQAIKLNPDNLYEVFMSRGNAYWFLQHADADKYRPLAIADFSQTIKLNPKSDAAYFQRGDCYSRNLEYDKAISDFTVALNINPNFDKALIERGSAYWSQDRKGLAIIDYEKAAKINPKGYGEPRLKWAISELNKNEYPWQIITNEAKSALEKGEADEAIALYQKSIEVLPISWNSHDITKLSYVTETSLRINQISQAYLVKKDFDKALDLFQDANKSFYDELNRQFKLNTTKIDPSEFDEFIVLNLSTRLISWEHDLSYWSKFIEMTRVSLKSISAQPLSNQQRIRLQLLEILAIGQSQVAASRFAQVATDQFALAMLCKGRAANICGVNSRNNEFTKNYEKMLNTVNKGIEIYPNLKLSYETRAKIYRFMGKNDLAAADEQKTSLLKN